VPDPVRDVADLRRPLLPEVLVLRPDDLWTSIEVLPSTPSSNAELVRRARAGAAHGAVLVAEEQTAGRGRRDRGWSAPAHSSLMLSALVRPRVDPNEWGWLPLLTAVVVADVVSFAGVPRPEVKWPNDVLVGGRKIAGVLCEVVPEEEPRPAVVAGWGLNVSQSADELPHGGATSLMLEGGRTDRDALLRHALHRWSHWYRRWEQGDRAAVRAAYQSCSSTLGTRVRAALPGGRTLEGTAVALAEGGGLVVRVGADDVVVAAADVVHLR
jgi:BirA family transcriptional regulator, biotin operon repressor / biotin---[acetyl-CoA-carboxylase] ligase